ncbi:hypothetical protein BASA50_003267 [Batrachochytrium salamandrivorans]|uniref:Succinate dehydrogenase assembly factor 3 n=1 Tax=Batrachochytrium salamandrivorans TaxID=1357716 RepID=A0ABQ8FJ03_9FUNG|nr:hypothetical protein BASA50_003267 [Batrachochytrium salamandrivorans]
MPGNGPSPSDVLQLYRSIRRLHRHMPSALKFIGNRYVRDEFARHRNAQPEYLPASSKPGRPTETHCQTSCNRLPPPPQRTRSI